MVAKYHFQMGRLVIWQKLDNAQSRYFEVYKQLQTIDRGLIAIVASNAKNAAL